MKVAISLPDAVFRRVERAAKRLRISRSELLARAAASFLAEHQDDEVTASYDRAFSNEPGTGPTEGEGFQREAARRALRDVAW